SWRSSSTASLGGAPVAGRTNHEAHPALVVRASARADRAPHPRPARRLGRGRSHRPRRLSLVVLAFFPRLCHLRRVTQAKDAPPVTLKTRLIPCLDVKDGRVVKGVQFVDLVDAGDPVEAA